MIAVNVAARLHAHPKFATCQGAALGEKKNAQERLS